MHSVRISVMTHLKGESRPPRFVMYLYKDSSAVPGFERRRF